MGGAREGRPRQSRIFGMASGDWIAGMAVFILGFDAHAPCGEAGTRPLSYRDLLSYLDLNEQVRASLCERCRLLADWVGDP